VVASTVKLIGSGIDDPDFADKLSRLIGDHDVKTTSTSTCASESGKSPSMSVRQERIHTADATRALPKGTALVLGPTVNCAVAYWPWGEGCGSADGQAHGLRGCECGSLASR
jgi:hypothetical protein